MPEALTGIAVNGVRYSTYSYYPDGRVNSSGLLTGSVEQNTFVYGANTTQVTNAGGASATYTYQTINGNKSLVQIDQAGITNCPNTSATIHYDANGHQDYTVDQRGVKTTYVYNSIGMLQDVVGGIDPNNPGQQREAQMTWDTGKNRITNVRMLDSGGSAVLNLAYAYYPDSVAARNRLQSVVSTNLSANGVTNQTQTVNYRYSFNSNGIPAQFVIDGPGGSVTRNYDAAGNLTSVANALGHTAIYSGYNGLGLPAAVGDPNGFTMSYVYDVLGRTTSISRTLDGVAATTTLTYDGLGDVTKVNYPGGGYLQNAYDGAGRLTQSVTDISNGGVVQEVSEHDYTYNNFSRITTDAIHQTITDYSDSGQPIYYYGTPYLHTWTYDSLGRILTDQGNHSQKIQYSYDPVGNVATTTDSLGNVTRYTYNAFNQIQTVTGPLNQVARYAYDGVGNLVAVTDPKGNTTRYAYDGFGNLITQASSDTGTTSYSYNALGQQTQVVRANGATTQYSYDSLGRVTQAQGGGQTITYGYDTCANGKTRLCNFTDTSGTTSYGYRLNGQLLTQSSVIGGTNYTTSWAYDNRERVTSVTYPGGNKAGYSYDTQSHVAGVTVTINGIVTTLASEFLYDADGLGPISSFKTGDGKYRLLNYDTDYRLTSLSDTNVVGLSYGYDADNRLTTLTNGINSALTQTYSYDTLGRLGAVTSNSGNQSWTFDANGNRTGHSYPGGSDTYYPYNSSNWYNDILGTHARSVYYDNLGNITSKTGWGGNQTYAYDPFNRLVSLTTASGTTSYAVNALNQRVRKSGPNGTYQYLYGPDGSLLGETGNGSSTLSTQYVWLGGAVTWLDP